MKYRVQAFLVHLLLSAVVLSAILAGVALVWYPSPLFWADGGREVIQLIAFVDVVLGPSLTFVVYRKGKKSLKADLAVIVAIQIAALAYGVLTMYQQRPVFIAFVQDKFFTVTAAQIEEKGIRKLAELGAITPRATNWVYVALPEEPAALQQLLVGAGQGETLLLLRSDLYRPLDAVLLRKVFWYRVDVERMLEQRLDGDRIQERDALAAFLAKHTVKAEEVAFIPFVARYKQMFVAYRLADGTLLGYLDVRPELFGDNVR